MSHNDDLAKKIKKLRLAKKAITPSDWSQKKVAKMLGLPQQTYSDLETGRIKNPKRKILDKIATLYGTTLDYLHGRSSIIPAVAVYSRSEFTEAPASVGLIPVLSSKQVVENYIETGGNLNEINAIPVYKEAELNYRALEVNTDSMFRSAGFAIEKGSIVIYDPSATPKSGNIVVAKLQKDDQEAYCRQYINEGGTKVLQAFNEKFIPTPLTDDSIIYGVVKRKIVDVPF